MELIAIILVVFLAPAVFIIGRLANYTNNAFNVDVKRREALVIQNKDNSRQEVLFEGRYFRARRWKQQFRVNLNRKRLMVTGEVFVPNKRRGGNYFTYEFNFHLLIGREFDPTTGELVGYDYDNERFTTPEAIANDGIITAESILLAVNSIDPEEHEFEVTKIVNPELDIELANHTTDDLIDPRGQPLGDTLRAIARAVVKKADPKMTHLGLNILAPNVEDMRLSLEEDRKAVGAHTRTEKYLQAQELLTADDNLTPVEAMAAAMNADFGKAALAEAAKYFADKAVEAVQEYKKP